VWFSEQWDHFMTGLDAKTGKQLKRFKLTERYRINSSGWSNFAMDKNGYAYETDDHGNMIRLDTRTGEVKEYKFPGKVKGTYDNIITPDGKYWAGGGSDLFAVWDTQNAIYNEYPARTPFVSYSRGEFDKDGNAWLTGRGSGLLVKLDMKTRRLYEYNPPLPYATAYEAMPDKNGDVWMAVIQSGIMFRFTPRTEKWIGYRLPEPYSHNRRAWIDNSTDPVSVWYVDHNGYMVRIQPLD
jgi:streptogramin lyase